MPPLPEQRRFVAKVDELVALAALEAARASAESLLGAYLWPFCQLTQWEA